MPARSQELEWFMCAGMLREEDLGLEESKGPGLRIDLLSRRITEWVGIWLRESLLKGIASFVFPRGMLTNVQVWCYFNKKTRTGPCFFFFFLFFRTCFPLKVPIATCIVRLKVINQMYCLAVNLPVSFVPSTKCKENASMRFFDGFMWKSKLSVLYCTFRLSGFNVFSVSKHNQNNVSLVVLLLWFGCNENPFAASGGKGGWGILWSVHSSLHFFSFLPCVINLSFSK